VWDTCELAMIAGDGGLVALEGEHLAGLLNGSGGEVLEDLEHLLDLIVVQ
jgi:hypothetical protein